MKKLLFAATLLIFFSVSSSASHLMGGSLTYQFLSHDTVNNQDHYRVKLQLFRDCTAGNATLNNQYILGVYSQDPNNPNSSKILYNTFTINRDSLNFITPPSPGDSCNFTTSVCVQEGDYHVDIVLGSTLGGYHLIIQLNARNATIVNLYLPPNPNPPQGQTYYTFIPPSSIHNSSPAFADVPVPFICTSDTVSIVNLANDIDGDSLAYSFVVPYDAYSTGATPPPPATITVPPPVVIYNTPNYSFAQPFGAGGFAAIDSITGLTQYYIPNIGNYVVCVQIDEYRNGVFISSTRRDLQLIAVSCPFNPTPVLSTTGGSGITVYNITEGQTLCFPVTITDPNGDSIYVHASGNLFDSTIVNPHATLPDAAGQPTVTSQFCWTTGCGQGRVAPYQFNVSGQDNGCPPKIANVIYSIYVHPFAGPIGINGPDSVCNQQSGVAYSVANSPSTFHWSVTNGVQASGGTTSNITVDWGNAASGTISVYAVSQYGCTRDTISKTVVLKPLPVVSASADPDSVCPGGTSTLFAIGANSYSWATTLAPGVPIGTGDTMTVHPAATTSYIVTGTATSTCVNRDTVTLFDNPPPPVNATAAPDSVCAGNSSTLTAAGAISYWWATMAQPNDTVVTGSSLVITPDSVIAYIVTGTDAIGCVNKDTVTIAINPLPLVDSISGTRSLCPGVTGVGYIALPSTATSSYLWLVQHGTIASGQEADTVFANWDTTSGPGWISVIETTNRGCVSDTVTLPISINLILTPASPFGITPICEENADSSVYSTFNTPGSIYTWGVDNGTIISPNGTNTITINWDSTGTDIGVLWYMENSTTTDTLCFGISDTLYVTIHARPATSSIFGAYVLCAFDTGNIYLVTPDSASSYSWNTAGGTITGGNGTNAIQLNWGLAGTDTITVIETNLFGCVGRPVDTTVLIHPLPLANAGAPAAICSGDSTTLNASGGNGYLWSPSAGLSDTTIDNPFAFPLSSTQYIVEVTDSNNCRNNDSVLVTVNSLPNADAGNNISICFGHADTLIASGGTQYLWTPATGLSNSTIYNPIANPSSTITYYVNVGDANNCHSTDSVVVSVLSLPVAFAGVDTITCAGSGIHLEATGGNSYQWSPLIGLDNTHISNPLASPANPTTYTVTVTGANNCTNTDQVFVDVNPMPHSDFSVEPTVSCNGLELRFTKQSTNDLNYTWLFGDGSSTSTEQDPTHIYAYGVPYNISLITVNNFCIDTMTIAKPEIGIGNGLDSLQNVFTPNNDGLNDCFRITPVGGVSDCATLTVFNRWGETVFEGTAALGCWNGKNKNGNDCPAGIYFFVVKVGNATQNGSVQLIRE